MGERSDRRSDGAPSSRQQFAETTVSDISTRVSAVLEGLETDGQAALLAQIAHNLTVSAREDYHGDERPLGILQRIERLRRYNEIQHRLTAQVAALLTGNESRYPMRVLLDIMEELAGTDTIGISLCESFRWAFSLALDQRSRV